MTSIARRSGNGRGGRYLPLREASGSGSAANRQSRKLVMTALCAADFLVVLDGLIVAVALPTVQVALRISAGSLQWVVTAYLLCFGGFQLLGGRLGDLYGRRRILLTGLGLFAAGAVFAGLAWTLPVLIAGRAMQGLGAALMTPAALALLTASFEPGDARDHALGVWSAAGSLGLPAGALVGGICTAAFGWRTVLLVNAPAAGLAALAAWRVVPEGRDVAASPRVDIPGAVLVTGGLVLLITGITGTEHAHGTAGLLVHVVAPALAGVVLLLGFVAVERRTAAPLVPLSLLRTPGLLVVNLVGAALPIGLGASLFLATLYLQRVLHTSPLQTGLAYLALALPVLPASPLASRLVARFGTRPTAVAGLALQSGGLLLLARAPTAGGFARDVLPGFVVVGIGAPVAFVPVTCAAMATAHRAAGLISGVFNTAQQIGNALALTVLATVAAITSDVFRHHGVAAPAALTAGYATGFLLAALLIAISTVAALRLPNQTADHGR